MSCRRTPSVIALAAAIGVVTLPAMAQTIPCKYPRPKGPFPSQAPSLALLGSVTQLSSKIGAPVLTSNLATTVAINNTASDARRAQALSDAQITAVNANTLADGLGLQMGAIYRRSAFFKSSNDGATATCGEISPAVTAIIGAAEATTGPDSGADKNGYANGWKGKYAPPAGGVLNVLGQFYGVKNDAPGADPNGNPRPFQTAPLDATSGLRIRTYDGKDFFGVSTNSKIMLVGESDEDRAAGRTGSDLRDNPSYPSGHTTFGYTESLLLALMVPERFRAMVYRGSEYGDSRIVIGAHYAIDVIGGRTLATYDLAQALAGKTGYGSMPAGTFQDGLAAAARDLRDTLRKGGCPDIAVCALDPIIRADQAIVMDNGRPKPASVQSAYAFRLNYGLAPMASENDPPEVMPVKAGFLLQSRFPYLTVEQRSDVLRTTEGPSGHFLDVNPTTGSFLSKTGDGPDAQVGAYSRINLFAAAGGYMEFADRVVVEQDPALVTDPHLQPFADFAKADTWSNDIGGQGGLTKRGSGTLTLTGANTYAGPTLIEGGTLEIAGSVASPTTVESSGTLAGSGHLGEVYVLQGGRLAPGAVGVGGPMGISGSLSVAKGGAVSINSAGAQGTLKVAGNALLDDAGLIVSGPLKIGQRVTVLTAKKVVGAFGRVELADPTLAAELEYKPETVILTVKAKKNAAL